MPLPRVSDLNSWARLMQDKVNGPKISEFAKKTQNDDLLKFLVLMKAGHKGKNEYDLFIKRGAKYQLNIDDDVREEFETVAAQKPSPNWSSAPWAEVTTTVLGYFNTNIGGKIK